MGRRADVRRCCRRSSATCSASPAGRWRSRLDLVPRRRSGAPLRGRHRRSRLPGDSRGRPAARGRRAGARARRHWVDYVALVRASDWEVLRRAYLETPWNPDDLPRGGRTASTAARCWPSGSSSGFKDERLRQMATHPLVADGHEPRNVPAWAGLVGVPRAAVRRVDGHRRHGGAHRGADGPDGDPQGDGALDVEVPTSWCGTDARSRSPPRRVRARRGRGGVRDRSADAARARAVRRADDAHDAAGGLPRRARRRPCPTCRTRWSCTATRCWCVRTGGRAPAGGAAYTLHGRGTSPRTSSRRSPGTRLDVRTDLVTRVDLSPRDLVEQWRSSPYGVLWQGRGTVPAPARAAHAGRGRVRRRRARAPGHAGCRTSGLSAALVAQVVGPA